MAKIQTTNILSKPITATFENAQFEALTGGYLDNRERPSIIIEIKQVERGEKSRLIQMQESAQMVAWIKSDSELAQTERTTYVCFNISPSYFYI